MWKDAESGHTLWRQQQQQHPPSLHTCAVWSLHCFYQFSLQDASTMPKIAQSLNITIVTNDLVIHVVHVHGQMVGCLAVPLCRTNAIGLSYLCMHNSASHSTCSIKRTINSIAVCWIKCSSIWAWHTYIQHRTWQGHILTTSYQNAGDKITLPVLTSTFQCGIRCLKWLEFSHTCPWWKTYSENLFHCMTTKYQRDMGVWEDRWYDIEK